MTEFGVSLVGAGPKLSLQLALSALGTLLLDRVIDSLEHLQGDGFYIVDALSESGLCRSKGEARRLVQQGGAYVNNQRVDSIDRQLTTADLVGDSMIVLRTGRKKYALLRLVR